MVHSFTAYLVCSRAAGRGHSGEQGGPDLFTCRVYNKVGEAVLNQMNPQICVELYAGHLLVPKLIEFNVTSYNRSREGFLRRDCGRLPCEVVLE